MACKVKVNQHGFLAFHLFWNRTRSWEGTGLRDTPENREFAKAQAVIMSREIKKRKFDYLKWFPEGNKAHLFRVEESTVERKTLREYFEEWMRDKVPPLFKKSRARKYRSHFQAHVLDKYGESYLDSFTVAHIRDLRAELVDGKGLSVKTANDLPRASTTPKSNTFCLDLNGRRRSRVGVLRLFWEGSRILISLWWPLLSSILSKEYL